MTKSLNNSAGIIYNNNQKGSVKIVNTPQELSRGVIREGSVLFIDNLFRNFPYEFDPPTQDFTLIATIDQEIIDDGKQ